MTALIHGLDVVGAVLLVAFTPDGLGVLAVWLVLLSAMLIWAPIMLDGLSPTSALAVRAAIIPTALLLAAVSALAAVYG